MFDPDNLEDDDFIDETPDDEFSDESSSDLDSASAPDSPAGGPDAPPDSPPAVRGAAPGGPHKAKCHGRACRVRRMPPKLAAKGLSTVLMTFGDGRQVMYTGGGHAPARRKGR